MSRKSGRKSSSKFAACNRGGVESEPEDFPSQLPLKNKKARGKVVIMEEAVQSSSELTAINAKVEKIEESLRETMNLVSAVAGQQKATGQKVEKGNDESESDSDVSSESCPLKKGSRLSRRSHGARKRKQSRSRMAARRRRSVVGRRRRRRSSPSFDDNSSSEEDYTTDESRSRSRGRHRRRQRLTRHRDYTPSKPMGK